MLIYNGKIFDWKKPDDHAEIRKIAALMRDGAWSKTHDDRGHVLSSGDGGTICAACAADLGRERQVTLDGPEASA